MASALKPCVRASLGARATCAGAAGRQLPAVNRRQLSVNRRHQSQTSANRCRVAAASSQYDTLSTATVLTASTGDPVELGTLLQGERTLVALMTHFADLSSWEFCEKLMEIKPELDAAGVDLVMVGLGSPANARAFARYIGDIIPQEVAVDKIYAIDNASMYKTLGYSAGFGEDLEIDPYFKLLPMLMGIGSPGTVQEVLRGYVGDKSAEPVFKEGSTLGSAFNVLGGGYQRPFELATLRLFNMVGILPKWEELCPADTTLLTQQGGAILLQGEDVLYEHVDSGILKFADVNAILPIIKSSSQAKEEEEAAPEPIPVVAALEEASKSEEPPVAEVVERVEDAKESKEVGGEKESKEAKED